ncbi:substrate-binding periplasmic protein [Roseibium sediminicola]|uniref:Transporter substrate-binding domain-containing protein n=1 Tax=Roseibium sediminicola TaxID=2933272 RepID=A0ABT0H2B7_9HYPH|nr:transporter substrate-binding domain-containing protein [Roseibium sp. CAU 1639]MCK7615832.1 transporter substrate-binding domain-containing protein [Roseibium sp. CAU 1639]
MQFLLRITFLWVFVFTVSAVEAQQRLVLSTLESTPNGRIGAAILKRAYAEIGIEIEIYQTSGQRGLMLSSAGAVDGEVVRFGVVGDLHPTLRRVDVPIVRFAMTVFVKENAVSTVRLDNLAALRVGHLTGTVKLVELTQGFSDVWRASSNSELFEMLAAERLDAVISDTVAGRIALGRLGLSGITELKPPLVQDNLYHFLHEKHSHLVPEIGRVLQRMTQTGELRATIEAEIKSMTGHEALGSVDN